MITVSMLLKQLKEKPPIHCKERACALTEGHYPALSISYDSKHVCKFTSTAIVMMLNISKLLILTYNALQCTALIFSKEQKIAEHYG